MGASLTKESRKRASFLPFFKPSIGEEEIAEVVDTMQAGWLTTGPKTKRFEEAFAEYTGAKYAVAVNSCTAALHLALAAHGIKPGDEVITTPLTFCATVEAIEYVGASPILVDIDPFTGNIDHTRIEEAITKKTRAIIPVHYGGRACDMEQILEIAARYGLFVLEDSAHAAGTIYNGKKVGSIGHAAAFSFYANKNMTTAEGGMITTNIPELAEKMRILSLHGISKDAWKRYSSSGSWYYEVQDLGFKYNMTDIQASMGIHQLAKLDKLNNIRDIYAQVYREELTHIPEIEFSQPELREGCFNPWHLFVIHLREEMLTINRAEFIDELRAEEIGTSVHYIPLHFHPHYQQKYGFRLGDFPQAEAFYRNAITLPLYPAMTSQDLRDVVYAVEKICSDHKR